MSIEIISEKKTQIGQVAVTFTVGRIVSQAKATEGKAGNAEGTPLVRQTTTGTGLRVGAADAVQPATSEFMDVTAGETAPNSTAVAETDRTAPENAGLLGGVPSAPDHTTMEER